MKDSLIKAGWDSPTLKGHLEAMKLPIRDALLRRPSHGKLKYEELITINSEGNKIKFLAEDTASDVIKNLLLSIQSEGSTIFMILDGKVSYDDVNKLVNNK